MASAEENPGPHVIYVDDSVDLVLDEDEDDIRDSDLTSGRLYIREQPKAAPSVSGGISAAADVASHDSGHGSYHICMLWVPPASASADPDDGDGLQAFQVFLEDALTIRKEALPVAHNPPGVVLRITKKGCIPLPRLRFRSQEFVSRLVRTLRGYAALLEFPEDPDLLHVQQSPRPRRATATFLHLGTAFVPPHLLLRKDASTPPPAQQETPQLRQRHGGRPPRSSRRRPPPPPDSSALIEMRRKNLGFAVLSQFAQVTKLVRSVGDIVEEGVRALQHASRAAQDGVTNVEDVLFGSQDVGDMAPPMSTPQLPREHSGRSDNDNRDMPEFFKAEEPRGVPVSKAAFLASFSRRTGVMRDVLSVRQAIFDGGIEPEARSLVWPFILDVYVWELPTVERLALLDELRKEYVKLKQVWRPATKTLFSPEQSRGSEAANQTASAASGEIESDDRRQGDTGHEVSGEGSGALSVEQSGSMVGGSNAGVSGSTSELFASNMPSEETQLAWNILGQARDGSFGEQDVELVFPSARLRDQSLQIAKDVLRTDRTVNEFADDHSVLLARMTLILMTYGIRAPHIGYCQGMSDMLTPILFALKDEEHCEVLSFWCFTKLMDRINANFREDQSGIRAQLRNLARLMRLADRDLAAHFAQIDPEYHSCFRWLLVQFKREIRFEDISRLWEVCWLDFVAERELHVYVAVGLLIMHRDVILAECDSFPELLRFINDMSMRIDVDLALTKATELYYRIGPVETEQTRPLTSLRRGNSQDIINDIPAEALSVQDWGL